MKKTKKTVLWATLIIFSIMLIWGVVGSSTICGAGNLSCRDNIGNMSSLLYSIPLLLVFSLITLKMREEVFQAWWGFARWWVPVIIVVTLLLNSTSGGGGGMGGGGLASGMFEFAVLWVLYIIFVLVSLYKIVRTYGKK